MLDLTYLYGGRESGSTPHRYGQALRTPGAIPAAQRHEVAASAATRRPVVVWHLTQTCNLACQHCYSCSEPRAYPNELTAAEARALLDDLAAFKVPALLLSGGEPTVRPDFLELAGYAVAQNLRLVLSTNGTRITPEFAARLKATGFAYVGISLDGLRAVHDRFRRHPGAFDLALAGIRNCLAIGQKTGLRLTLTRSTLSDLPGILELIEREGVPRVCFYHLVPAGRGLGIADLTPAESRQALETLLVSVRRWAQAERPIEVLTVDNPCDGPFLYQKLQSEGQTQHAAWVLERLRWNGGALSGSGVGLGDIDPQGGVHPDQFWPEVTLGRVRERPFSAIWSDPSQPMLAALRNRRGHITGRCAGCAFFEACGGGLRSRAAHVTGNPWASDPACYLTDAEIRGGT